VAHELNGTSQYLKSTATVTAPASAYSYHFWFRTDHVPTITADATGRRTAFGLNSVGFDYDAGIIWDHEDSGFYRTAYHKESGGSYKVAQLSANPSANTWHALTVTYNGTDLNYYVDGALGGTVAAAAAVATPNPTIFLGAYRPGAEANYMNGQFAEFALWNVALSAGEIAALYAGMAPIGVRMSGLVAYWPLLRDVVSLSGAAITTTNQGTAYTSPRLLMVDHGIDSMRWTNSATPASVSASWSSSITMTSNAPSTIQQLASSLSLSSSFVPPEVFDHLASSVKIQSRFRPRVSELSTRRSRASTTR
jgi:hypothetical protein